ncbi:MAG: YkgJ family cysteine cluster protein [bacterium]
MTEDSFYKKYIDITGLIRTEFNRNVDLYDGKILCKKGCSQCCHQIFNITMVDANIIKSHMNSLTEEKVNLLKGKAKNYLENFYSNKKPEEEYFSIPNQPCPALTENGECEIYEARPIICQRFGVPVYDYKNPEKIYACVLNFKEGEEIIDPELIPNQTYIGKKWDELKTEFNIEKGYNNNASTSISEAILNS